MIARKSIFDLDPGDILLDHAGRSLGAFVSIETIKRDPYAPHQGQRLVGVIVRPDPPGREFTLRFSSFGDVVSIIPRDPSAPGEVAS